MKIYETFLSQIKFYNEKITLIYSRITYNDKIKQYNLIKLKIKFQYKQQLNYI